MDVTRNILNSIVKSKEDKFPKINLEVAMEYAKWLPYIPDFQKERISKLLEKQACELSDIEIKQLEKFREQQQLAPIFSRYITSECKKEDLLPVYDYMEKTSLDKIMTSKLTEEELKQANKMIMEVSKCGHSELYSLVKNWQEPNAYHALTMIHAYCFHILKKIYIKRTSNELDEEIRVTTNNSNAYTVEAFGKRQKLTR